jgi:hypothetical protein
MGHGTLTLFTGSESVTDFEPSPEDSRAKKMQEMTLKNFDQEITARRWRAGLEYQK